MNLLESLKRYTSVVAARGDFAGITKHKPQDAITNPSLLCRVARKLHLVEHTHGRMHNEDAMAAEKLNADARKLEQYARTRVAQRMPADR